MSFRHAAALAAILLTACADVPPMHVPAVPAPEAAAPRRESVFEPYRFLVGEWNVGQEGGAPILVARFRFGPGESYLWYSASLVQDGREHPHFEGVLAWNGVRGNLDTLLVLDLDGGRIQEQGVVYALADGSVVRDITAYYSPDMPLPICCARRAGPNGASIEFRQTFAPMYPFRILTSLRRREGERWVPVFPGSDQLVMTRRPR
jgi:hypothetical protein